MHRALWCTGVGGGVSHERGTPVHGFLLCGDGAWSMPASGRRGNNSKGLKDFDLKARPESGLDCRMCAMFTRRQASVGRECGMQKGWWMVSLSLSLSFSLFLPLFLSLFLVRHVTSEKEREKERERERERKRREREISASRSGGDRWDHVAEIRAKSRR